MAMPKIPRFETLRWEMEDEDFWLLRHGDALVGEVYEVRPGDWKWHCKASDWRDVQPTAEEAKLSCVVSYVKELMYVYTMARVEAERVAHAPTAGEEKG